MIQRSSMAVPAAPERRPFGEALRRWRQHRRYSQLALALEAGTSARHLSFLETGRAAPSREMVHRLAERLEVPLRERNALLLAAGFAPGYRELPLEDAAGVREAVELLLAAFEPCPALAVDRGWTLVAANRALAPLLEGVSPSLLQPPVNVLRLSLHPGGLAPRIVNLAEWRAHVLARVARDAQGSADEGLHALLEELRSIPAPGTGTHDEASVPAVAVPLRLRTPAGELRFLSTTTVFGTATDVALSEVTIESFLPADEPTRAALHHLAGARP